MLYDWTKSDPYISEAFARVTNKSLESGVFEQAWKNARVSHIYKDDGNINDEITIQYRLLGI